MEVIFSFAELFDFLLTGLGLVLAFLGGRQSVKRKKKKSRPNRKGKRL